MKWCHECRNVVAEVEALCLLSPNSIKIFNLTDLISECSLDSSRTNKSLKIKLSPLNRVQPRADRQVKQLFLPESSSSGETFLQELLKNKLTATWWVWTLRNKITASLSDDESWFSSLMLITKTGSLTCCCASDGFRCRCSL